MSPTMCYERNAMYVSYMPFQNVSMNYTKHIRKCGNMETIEIEVTAKTGVHK